MWNNFKKVRNTYIGKLREAEKQYKENLAQKLKNPNKINSKQWWHLTKYFLGKHSNTSTPPIINPENEKLTFMNSEKAEIFNKAFSSFSNLDTSHATIPNNLEKTTNTTLNAIHVTENEIKDVLLY